MDYKPILLCVCAAFFVIILVMMWMLHQNQTKLIIALGETKTESAPVVVSVASTPPPVKTAEPTPPTREYPSNAINVATRGEVEYQQIGVLYPSSPDEKDTVIPLYGKPTYVGSNYWNYYVESPGYHSSKLGITIQNRDCVDMTGCRELSNGDTITIPELGGKAFTSKLYATRVPKYIPYVV